MAVKTWIFALVLSTSVNAGLIKRVACPGTTETVTNAACCAWLEVRDDLQANLFNGQCGQEAHEAIRLTVNDAMGFSNSLAATGFGGGGADGSIISFGSIEQAFPLNDPLSPMAQTEQLFADIHGVGYADMIQFAAAVGLSNCAGAPTLEFLIGRKEATAASPEGLVPDPEWDVKTMLARFEDAGLDVGEMVALISAHSVDSETNRQSMDSTPSVFDTQIFIEVLLKALTNVAAPTTPGDVSAGIPNQIRLQSDQAIARDPTTACLWQDLVDKPAAMASQFKAAMSKLSLIGQTRSLLTDCSDIIPVASANNVAPFLPAGKTMADIEQSCATAAFPVLPTASSST